jgi:cytoskeletal protein CcmA (bactofilin family)
VHAGGAPDKPATSNQQPATTQPISTLVTYLAAESPAYYSQFRDLNKDSAMALWKDSAATKEAPPIMTPPPAEPVFKREPEPTMDIASQAPRRVTSREAKESIVASDITITGKIVGAGHVRIAGRFEGDVHIEGNLTIEHGAKLTGAIRAESVAIAGEVEGNIENAAKVELLATGVLNGDVKAGTLTVAAGSRMRGRAEFGWGEDHSASMLTLESRQAS